MATDKLQRLKNHEARIVTYSPNDASAAAGTKQLRWRTVRDSIATVASKMAYKCINDEAPSYSACLFDRLSETGSKEI